MSIVFHWKHFTTFLGITYYSGFSFSDKEMTFWEAGTMGPGKTIKMPSNLKLEEAKFKCEVLTSEGEFIPVKKDTPVSYFKPSSQKLIVPKSGVETVARRNHEADDEENIDPTNISQMPLPCKNEICEATFHSNEELQNHMIIDSHYVPLREESIANYAKRVYFNKFSLQQSTFEPQERAYLRTQLIELVKNALPEGLPMQDLTLDDNYAEGWASVPKRKKGRLDQDVVAFVEQKFWQGQDFGQKKNSKDVHEAMKVARHPKDKTKKMFQPVQYLSIRQIDNIWNRMTYKLKHPEKDIPEDEETAQEVIALGMSDHEVDVQARLVESLHEELTKNDALPNTSHPMEVKLQIYNYNNI